MRKMEAGLVETKLGFILFPQARALQVIGRSHGEEGKDLLMSIEIPRGAWMAVREIAPEVKAAVLPTSLPDRLGVWLLAFGSIATVLPRGELLNAAKALREAIDATGHAERLCVVAEISSLVRLGWLTKETTAAVMRQLEKRR